MCSFQNYAQEGVRSYTLACRKRHFIMSDRKIKVNKKCRPLSTAWAADAFSLYGELANCGVYATP
jgi:hypothetical protein